MEFLKRLTKSMFNVSPSIGLNVVPDSTQSVLALSSHPLVVMSSIQKMQLTTKSLLLLKLDALNSNNKGKAI